MNEGSINLFTPHILIVDDQPINASCLKAIFDECGYRVSTLLRGAEVMAAVENDAPDLILLDIMMPEMDGYQVCAKLKSSPPAAAIPVIFITALKEIDSVIKCFDLGGADYIIKPFNRLEVLARVNTQLKLKASKDELKRLNEWKDNLLAVISHDMRGPFNNFCLYIDLLRDNLLDPVGFIKENYDELNYSINNVKYMMDNILQWAISQREGFEPQEQPVSIKELAAECFVLFEKSAALKNIELKVNIADDIVFNAERQLILTAMRNLIQNAVKYTRTGGRVEVSADEAGDFISIYISDNGVGIPAEKLAELFTNPRKTSSPGTKNERGAGIGLSICSELIEKCGGRLMVKSEPGKGSEFCIKLPEIKGAADKVNGGRVL
jgi:signal transduction histidine kinase